MKSRYQNESLYNHLLSAYVDTNGVCLSSRDTEKVFEFIRAACHYVEILEKAGDKPTTHEKRIMAEYLPMLLQMKKALEHE